MKSSSFAERRCHEAGIELLELAGAEAPPSGGAPVHPEGRDHRAAEIPERSGHEAGIEHVELDLAGAASTEAALLFLDRILQ
jgi:hypothetical protein